MTDFAKDPGVVPGPIHIPLGTVFATPDYSHKGYATIPTSPWHPVPVVGPAVGVLPELAYQLEKLMYQGTTAVVVAPGTQMAEMVVSPPPHNFPVYVSQYLPKGTAYLVSKQSVVELKL